jgi:hypothetical protein
MDRQLHSLEGVSLVGKPTSGLRCTLSLEAAEGGSAVQRIVIVDKHGLSRDAYNLQIFMHVGGQPFTLGLAMPAESVPTHSRA